MEYSFKKLTSLLFLDSLFGKYTVKILSNDVERKGEDHSTHPYLSFLQGPVASAHHVRTSDGRPTSVSDCQLHVLFQALEVKKKKDNYPLRYSSTKVTKPPLPLLPYLAVLGLLYSASLSYYKWK